MAKQEVEVSKVDVIKAYNRRFGDFRDAFSGHLHQLLDALNKRLENMHQMQEDIKREREILDEEIRVARQRLNDSFRSDDDRYVFQCRQEYDHLTGHIYHNMQHCSLSAHSSNLSAKQSAGFIEYKTKALEQSFHTYISRGRQFLDKAVLYVEQYKENTPNA